MLAAEEVKRVMIASDDNSSPKPPSMPMTKYELPEDYQSPHIHTYKVTYRCRFCSHEWDDLIQLRA